MHFHIKNGYWILLATIWVMQSDIDTGYLESSLKEGANRIISSILGVLIGLLGYKMMQLIASDGYIWLIYIAIFSVIFITTFLNQLYKGLKFTAISATIIMMVGLTDGHVLFEAKTRALEILIGVFVGVMTTICIWPNRQYKQLEKHCQTLPTLVKQQVAYFHDQLATHAGNMGVALSGHKQLIKHVKHTQEEHNTVITLSRSSKEQRIKMLKLLELYDQITHHLGAMMPHSDQHLKLLQTLPESTQKSCCQLMSNIMLFLHTLSLNHPLSPPPSNPNQSLLLKNFQNEIVSYSQTTLTTAYADKQFHEYTYVFSILHHIQQMARTVNQLSESNDHPST